MDKEDVKDYLMRGIYGPPELRREEKIRYLGEFRERIVLALTQRQVRRREIPSRVMEALDAYPGLTIVLNGEMEYEALSKYIRLANERNVPYRKIYDHETDTEIGLVLASPEPVDVPSIYLPEEDGAGSPGGQKKTASPEPGNPIRKRRRAIAKKLKAKLFRQD